MTNTPELPKPVKPRGHALERTDAQIAAMTGPAAMAALADEAVEDWMENAPREFRMLLSELNGQR